MKQFQDISVVVVGFLTFALIGYFIHTLASYNYCERELDCEKSSAILAGYN